MAGPVHYEVYIRKTAPAPWSLLMATEDRKVAVETAEDLLKDDRAAAVRVTKETLDPDTMAFSSLTVLTRGAPEVRRKRLVDDAETGPACASPQDLYAPHARELLGRVMEDWLSRNGVTAFELLHRPDVPYRVVLNEAIESAKRFGSEHGHTYVNGVLDRAAVEWRKVESGQ